MSNMKRSGFKAAIQGDADRIPVWFMRQAGRYLPSYIKVRRNHTIRDICANPELMADIAFAPVQDLGVDAAIIFYDILFPLEELGYNVEFVEKEGPRVTHQEANEIINARLDPNLLLKALRLFRARHPDTYLIGFCGGPITLASYAIAGGSDRDLSITLPFSLREEHKFRELMSEILELITRFARSQISAGVDAIQIFDSWAGSLPASVFTDYSERYLSQIAAELSGNTQSIYFLTKSAGKLTDLARTKFDFVSIDSGIRLSQANKLLGKDKGLQGNLDPVFGTLGTDLAVREVLKVLQDSSGIQKYIFNLGHGVLQNTDPATLKKIVEVVHEYSR